MEMSKTDSHIEIIQLTSSNDARADDWTLLLIEMNNT